MSHNDMEGIFRDAAENYQIRTDKAYAWDKVNDAVHKTDGDEPRKPEKKNKRRFVFWCFFLISLGLFSYSIWQIEFSTQYKTEGSEQSRINHNKHAASDKQNTVGTEQSSAQKNNPKQSVGLEKNEQDARGATTGENNADKINKQNSGIAKNNLQQNNIETLINKNNPPPINNKAETNLLQNKPNNDLLVNNDARNNTENNFLPQPLPLNKSKEKINNDSSETSQTNKTRQQINTAAKKNSTNKNQHGFYAGVQVSPDITVIKFQKSNGVGIEFGLTAGYQLNNRWSIETGVLLNTKKYYTKGKYFDKSNVWFPAGSDLVSVTGKCTMIEIPLNARYRFSINNKQNFSISAGTSSYFMTKEYYDYFLTANAQTTTIEETYHSSSKSLLAVINVGVGYERKIGTALTFKAEPYFKIPVSGIGTGKLRMSSTGINLGVIKYFGKK